ncbi:20267_t:CDS:2 [Gigaspora margarita]|uniref:20267_t:CDS:1 n=1 Tax=Gigaspora margarita TaxID=4874 RepID=A0ABM8W239_GIGMA|nr:20267_t:CDS:2 [Gigaspora margarita]
MRTYLPVLKRYKVFLNYGHYKYCSFFHLTQKILTCKVISKMKFTFLLRLFVLGFFSDVVLTSPLVARQELPECPESSLQCRIVQETSVAIPFPNPCDTLAICDYDSGDTAYCTHVDLTCSASEVTLNKFFCSSSGSQCGFTCRDCLIAPDKSMSCSDCKNGINNP